MRPSVSTAGSCRHEITRRSRRSPAEFLKDADRLLDVVTRLTDLHEQTRADRWHVSDAPDAFIQGQLKGIVGVRMSITRLLGKRKMSQNRSAEDRAGVAHGLAASRCPMQQRVAALIPVEAP